MLRDFGYYWPGGKKADQNSQTLECWRNCMTLEEKSTVREISALQMVVSFSECCILFNNIQHQLVRAQSEGGFVKRQHPKS